MAQTETETKPEFIAQRLEVFERIWKEEMERVAALPKEKIEITLPNGKVVEGESNKTTPLNALKEAGIATGVVAVKVDGELYHITKSLTKSCKIETLTFDDEEGKHVFWHSSSHVLGAVLEELYEARLGVGPAVEKGFYYDARLKDDKILTTADLPTIQSCAQKFAQGGYPFLELDVTKEQALEMFKYNSYKVELITEKVADGDKCRVFRCGSFIDFCRGPHVPNTRLLAKEFHINNSGAVYWKADSSKDSLQRVYGISFPNKTAFEAYQTRLEELKKRKHTRIGTEQELFLLHELSPGCPIFLPHGARVYRALEGLIRDVYWQQGYEEVLTPTFYNVKLWETSGHWQHYQNNMYTIGNASEEPQVPGAPAHSDDTSELFGLKPMNCPGHCLIFKSRTRSIHDLPYRMADFGEIHRKELSGTLRGLTRVRRFHQDDAHIFCAREQIKTEVANVLKFINDVYGIFGFTFKLGLSTRPEGSIGSDENWSAAEAALTEALNDFGRPYNINPGDGAFYGPKIDIALTDALGRDHQCATCQLDFNLPERFDLKFVGKTGSLERPVMIHRAVLGSLERFMAVLLEHTGGKLPFWVSPRQVYIVVAHVKDSVENADEIRTKVHNYARKVWTVIHDQYRFYSELDDSTDNLGTKVQKGLGAKYNCVVTIGAKEAENNQVAVRWRDEDRKKKVEPEDFEEFVKKIDAMRRERK